jgi:hypothetical protein
MRMQIQKSQSLPSYPLHTPLVFAVLAALGMSAACNPECLMGTRRVGGQCVRIQMDAGTEGSTNAESAAGGQSSSDQSSSSMTVGTGSSARVPGLPSAGNGASTQAPAPPSGASSTTSSAGAGGGVTSPVVSSAAGGVGAQSSMAMSNASMTSSQGNSAAGGASPAGPACTPAAEACDGQDNDCDGKVDEDVVPKPCGSNVGACKPGTISCRNGKWDDEATECAGAVGPQPEVCDDARLDENCDGVQNENCSCTNGATMPCGNGMPPCKQGTVTCANGVWPTSCQGEVKGSKEICDGVDNDCNGRDDDGGDALCSVGQHCLGSEGCAQCRDDSDCQTGLVPECMTSYCDVARHTCAQKSASQGSSCSFDSSGSSGKCNSGRCVECLSAADCTTKVQTGNCTQATCSANSCMAKVTVDASCGSGKTCTSTGECRSSVYGNCATNNDCPTGTMCAAVGSSMPLRVCYPTCSQNFGSCSTQVSDRSGTCFSGSCLIQCKSCTVDDNRTQTCQDIASCPNGLRCLMSAGNYYCS